MEFRLIGGRVMAKQEKRRFISNETKILLGISIIITVILEIATSYFWPFNLEMRITTSITLFYAIIWLVADIFHSTKGSAFNRKSIIFDIGLIIMELVVAGLWSHYYFTYNFGWINVVGIVISVLLAIMVIFNS